MLIELLIFIAIGIAVAAPVGPIGMFCIRKTLERGFMGAVAVGMGAAIADGIYAFIGATGLVVISNFLLERANLIKKIGGIFLLYLAFKEFRVQHIYNTVISNHYKKFIKLVIQTFCLNISNPMTILSFIAIFTGFVDKDINHNKVISMVGGIVIGSMAWWLTLGLIIIKVKIHLSENSMTRIRYLSALILAGFGGWSIISSII